jgi:hypothetical protein
MGYKFEGHIGEKMGAFCKQEQNVMFSKPQLTENKGPFFNTYFVSYI